MRCRQPVGLLSSAVALALALVLVSLAGAAQSAPPATAITYAYDELGRLVAVSSPGQGAAKYTYDAVGNVTAIARPSIGTVAVLGFSPKTGPAGTSVTIYGTGFNATPAQNTVKFNGTVGTVTSAMATQLVATVPSGATTGVINVTSPTGSANSTGSFTVGPAGPSISGFTPNVVAVGGTLTVSGSGFDTAPSNDVVATGKTRAQVTAATATSLTTTVGGPGSGRVTVATPTGTAVSSAFVFVPPSPYGAADVDTTAQMAIGDTRTVSVGAANKIALVAFDGSSGQRVSLSFSSVTFGGSSCCSATASILNPDGSTVVSPSYFGTSGGFVDAATLPQDGTYTIVVDPQGTATGSASMTLNSVPADATASITPGGSAVTLATTVAGQNAALTFSGSAGQRVSLQVDNVTIGSGCCSATAALLAPDGSTLVPATYFGPAGGGSIDATTLPQAGTYTIYVNPQGTATGSARYTLFDVPPDAGGTMTPGGPPLTVTISTAGQNANVTFPGTQDQRISLDVSNVTIGTPSSCGTNITIKKPDGSTLASNTCVTTAGAFFDTTVLPATGTYTIAINPAGTYTGSLTLTLYDVPADLSSTITPGGAAVTVSPATPGQNANVTFEGTQNQRVSLDITNVTIGNVSSCGTAVTIKNPDGSTLASNTCVTTAGAFIDTKILPATGTYTIVVDPQGNRTGNATLTLYDVPADLSSTITPGGAAVTVSPATPGQNANVTFEGAQNQRVSLDITNVTIGNVSSCGTAVTIKNPDGSTLASNTCVTTAGAFIDTKILPATGTYTIVVDPQGARTGSATLTLYDVPADTTGTIAIGGGSVTVTLSTPGQNGTLTFEGTSGTNINLVLSNVTIGNATSCGTAVTIKKPDGSNQASNTCVTTSGATISTQLSATGTHTILVDPLGARTGSMTLTLNTGSFAFATPPARGGFSVFPQPLLVGPMRSESAASRAPRARTQANGPAPSISFDPPDGEDFEPGAGHRRGNWRRSLPRSPWASLAPLRARSGITALSGQVLTLNGRPIENVTVELEDTGLETTTDETGRFLIQGAAGGHHVLIVDGASSSTNGRQYGLFEIGVDLVVGRTTTLTYTIWMPRTDKAREVKLASPTDREVVVTTPKIPGLELHLQPGTTIKDEAGQIVTEVSITPIPVDRPPFPLPLGVEVPVYFTIQPGGAYLSKPAQLVYPNYTNLPAGQRVSFWHYDPKRRGWYVYGRGTVTANGEQVVPDASTRIYAFTGAMISGSPTPPDKGPKDKKKDGDPVDLGTGLFVYEKTDLIEPGPLPIALTRTYRQADANSYAFGLGATLPFDLRLWSVNNYQETDLVLPDGGRVHYVRVSPGTGFTDAVYEAQATSTLFYRSKISWNGSGWDLKLTDGTVFAFGDLAPLQSIRDRFGNAITLTRSSGSNGNVTQITSSSGRWIKLTYSGNRITQALDNSGRTVGYAYDASGRLQTVTDAKGGTTVYTYNGANQMTQIRDPRNITYLTNAYDGNGRVQTQTQADNSTFQFAYTADGNGNVTQTDVTDPRGNVRRVTFNADGYSTSDVEALGKPEQQTTTFERQAGTGLVTATVDQLGRRTEVGYDGVGNVTSITALAGTGNAVTTTFTYEPKFNQLETITDPLNHVTRYGYSGQGAPNSITDPLNKVTTIGSNGAGQPTTVTDPLNNSTTLGYLLGDLVTTTDALGNVTRRFVDDAGRLGSITDAVGNRTTYQYSALNELTRTTNPKGGQTNFAYDGNGNLTTLTDAATRVNQYTYDNLDRVATRKDGLLRQETYVHDVNGNLTRFTDRKGQITTFRYDALDRRTFVGFGTTGTPPNESFTSTVTFTYDGGDRLTSAVDSANGTVTDSYDDLDRLTQETSPQGTVSYTYDAADRRETMTVAGQPQVTYGYDAAGRLTSVSRGSSSASLAYDDAGRRTSVTLPDAVVQQYAYDNGSRLTGITYTRSGSTLGDLNYDYDLAGRRSAVWGSYARTGLPTAVNSFTYNAANEVTKVGNKNTSRDANGSLTNDGTTTFTWNNRVQLASLSKTGLSASFAYDGFGRRKSKTVNGTNTSLLHDGANVVQELSGSTPTANLLTGPGVDETFSRTDSSGEKSLLTEALGSTIALADTAGTVATSYTYDPFGNTTSSGASSSNSFQYTGRENDGTGLLALRARYYSPTLQRFLAEDPLGPTGDEPNAYAYVGNDPVTFTDPFGLCGSIPILDLINALRGRCGAVEQVVILVTYTPWGTAVRALRALRGIRAATRAAKAADGFPKIKPGSAGGATAGQRFPKSVKDAARAEDPTSTCVYCGRPGTGTQVDHSVPRSRGGDATLDNAQLACSWCNPSKGAGDYPANPPPDYTGPWPPPWWRSGR
jgi:RHS repeat-associated protein